MISREEADALVSGQSGCYLVRESPNSPGSFALSIRYGEWPYGLWSSEILLNKRSVLCRQCWDTNWNMNWNMLFFSLTKGLRSKCQTSLSISAVQQHFIFQRRKIIWAIRFSQVYNIPCVWIRVSKMIVFFSNYHWDYHFNANIQQFKHK